MHAGTVSTGTLQQANRAMLSSRCMARVACFKLANKSTPAYTQQQISACSKSMQVSRDQCRVLEIAVLCYVTRNGS